MCIHVCMCDHEFGGECTSRVHVRVCVYECEWVHVCVSACVCVCVRCVVCVPACVVCVCVRVL